MIRRTRDTMTKPEGATWSTEDAAEAAGVSYRMLDYWLRTGAVKIEGNATPGSGNRRHFTADEVAALVLMVRQYRHAQEIINDFATGLLWEITRTEQRMEQEGTDDE